MYCNPCYTCAYSDCDPETCVDFHDCHDWEEFYNKALIYNTLTDIASGRTNIRLRFNGRTRHRLPIACAAPGPSSAHPSVPHFTNRGSLNGCQALTLPFTAFEILKLL